MHFFDSLERSCRTKESLLCVGLDPRASSAREALEANRRLIEETSPYTACFKPNLAFYECLGPEGLRTLEETLRLIPEDTPVILDAKRGDIGSTAARYAEALFGRYRAGAVTLNPYAGRDSVAPFLDYADERENQ